MPSLGLRKELKVRRILSRLDVDGSLFGVDAEEFLALFLVAWLPWSYGHEIPTDQGFGRISAVLADRRVSRVDAAIRIDRAEVEFSGIQQLAAAP